MPVDVSIDGNVPPLPIFYKDIHNTEEGVVFSPSWIITMMEPDFSMAFNLNAMASGVLGTVLHYLFSVTVDPLSLFTG